MRKDGEETAEDDYRLVSARANTWYNRYLRSCTDGIVVPDGWLVHERYRRGFLLVRRSELSSGMLHFTKFYYLLLVVITSGFYQFCYIIL